MDVNDVKESRTRAVRTAPASRQRSVDSLRARPVTETAERVTLHPESTQKKQLNEARNRANSVINIINVADETTGEIKRLVKSLHGIAKQAENPEFSEQRKAVLESEANQLVEEIKRKAQTSTQGVKPLAGEEIRLDVEEKIGAPVRVKLPDSATQAFGLQEIKFDRQDAIGGVQRAVENAQQQLEVLSNAITDVQHRVQDSLSTMDVALQNSEAAQSTIRDVDEALHVAGHMGGQIGRAPQDALQSVGQLDRRMLNLLST